MVGETTLKQLNIVSLPLAAVAAATAWVMTDSLPVAGGILFGALVALLPFITWHLVIRLTDGFRNRKRYGIAILITLAKYAAIALLIFALFSRNAINSLAFVGGMSIILATLILVGFGSFVGKAHAQHSDDPGNHANHERK